LREIHDPPVVIYMLGELEPEHLQHSAAVIGTRRPTTYGQRLAKEIAGGLAQNSVGVVSGMAIGIDSIAHWGAIDSGGKTVAVLACGVDVCYPSSNKPLYKKLVDGLHGAVISEFPPGIRPEEWRFPARNRIVSGLSDAVLVIEAGESSGALITASIAFEQSRTVFAMPGRVDSDKSKGCHMLIRAGKAHLCENHLDIMRTMDWVPAPPVRGVPTVVELYGRERDLYDLISAEPVHFDYLVEKSGMPAPELSATLTMLELAGVVTRHPGDWYSRAYSATTLG
jgi:DNA processing protein